ncbi:MAG: NHL repeat-containing protein [Cyanobacteriota bacterium]
MSRIMLRILYRNMTRRAPAKLPSLPVLGALVLALSACGHLSSSTLSPSVVPPSALQPIFTPSPSPPAAAPLTLQQARQLGLLLPDNRIVLLLQEQGSDLVAKLPASEVDRWLARTSGWPGVEGIDLSITLGSYRQTATATLRQGQPATFTFTNPPAGEAELSAVAYRGSTTLAQGRGSLTLSPRSGISDAGINSNANNRGNLAPQDTEPHRRLSTLVLSEVEVPLLHANSPEVKPGQPLLLSGENLEQVEAVLFALATNPSQPLRGEIRSRSNDHLTVMPPSSLSGSVWVALADASGQGLGTLILDWPVATPSPSPSPLPTATARPGWVVQTLPIRSTSVSGAETESMLSLGEIAGIAADPEGYLYLADAAQHRIFRLSPEGELRVWAGTGRAGYRNGAANQAQFSAPQGLLWDPKGGLWVADSGNHCLRYIDRQQQVTTFAGSCVAGYRDGDVTEAQFRVPVGLALGPDGSLYVADRADHRIRRITAEGEVTTVAGTGQAGSSDGPAEQGELFQPVAVAVEANGRVWIADQGNHRIRVLLPSGQLTTLAGQEPGYTDGPLARARFRFPSGLALDAVGNLWIADRGNHCIRRVSLRGEVSTLAGQDEPGWQDGPAAQARFEQPSTLTLLPDGTVVVVDAGLPGLRRLSFTPTFASFSSPAAPLGSL